MPNIVQFPNHKPQGQLSVGLTSDPLNNPTPFHMLLNFVEDGKTRTYQMRFNVDMILELHDHLTDLLIKYREYKLQRLADHDDFADGQN